MADNPLVQLLLGVLPFANRQPQETGLSKLMTPEAMRASQYESLIPTPDPVADISSQRAAAPSPLGVMLELAGGPNARGITRAVSQGIRAYHGSPHDFDRFDMSKIGTGEGAQAYGHGLYFAENPAVAQSYKAAGQPSYFGADRIRAAQDILAEARGDLNMARTLADQRMRETTKYSEGKLWRDVINNLPDLVGKSPGRMYEVNINARPEQFLDWDRPLAAQSENVRQTIVDLAQRLPRPTKGPSIRNREAILSGDGSVPGDILYNNIGGYRLPAETSVALREAGIPGIKYLDQGSRSAGEGSRNYVVFDDSLIDILRKYGIAASSPLGALLMSGGDKPQPDL